MPTYSVTAPNGVTYKVDGPPNASQANLAYAVYLKHPESAKPKEAGFFSTLEDIGSGLVRGTGNLVSSLGSEAVSEAPKILDALSGLNPATAIVSAITPQATKERFSKGWAEGVAPATGAIQSAGKAVSNLVPERTTPDFEHSQGFFGGLSSVAVTAAESAPTTLAALAATAITKNPTAGMAIMGTLGGLQTYSGIRQQQKQEGIDDVGRAIIGTAASTALDVLTGTGGAISKIGRETAKEALEHGMRHIVKEAIKTGREEGLTEMAQNLIEQVAGGADPTTKQNLYQTVEAGLVGALMGTPVGFASAKINAARTKAAQLAPALHSVEVLKNSQTGEQVPEALDILTVPDKKGAVLVRDAGGNIQTVGIKNIEEMRAPPAEGEEHEPLHEVLQRKAQERKDDYDFAKATQDAVKDPENQEAIDIIAKRYVTMYGVGYDEAVKYAKAGIAKARAPQAYTTAATEEPGMPEDLPPFAPPEAYADEMGQAGETPGTFKTTYDINGQQQVVSGRTTPPAPAPTATGTPAPASDMTPERAALILNDDAAIARYAESRGMSEPEAINELNTIAEGVSTGIRYMRGRTPKDTQTASLGFDLPTQQAPGEAIKRDEYNAQRFASEEEKRQREAQVAAQEQEQAKKLAELAQRNKEIEQQRIAKVQNDIRAANKANKPYEVRYVPSSPTPYQVVGPEEADGSRELFVAKDNLTDFEEAAGNLVPYTSRPLSAQAIKGGREVPNTPYTQINEDLVTEINAARAANKITDSEKAALFQQIVDSSNRGGAKKVIGDGEKAYLAAMNDLRNAESDAAKEAAELKAANIAGDLRRVANNIVGNPVRARLKTLTEAREDERAGAKQRVGNAKVQEALGRMGGENVAPEQREQREAAIDLAEAKPTKYMRGEKEAGGPPKVVSVEEAQKAVNAASGAWKGRPNISVVNSIADLPAALRRAMEKDGAQNALGFVAPDGTVYIIADNALSVQDIRAALFHEALGHIGLEKLFRNTLDTALVGMYNNNAKLKADVDAWVAENPDAYKRDKNPLARAVEEVLAERSENGRLEVSFFRKIATIIRNFARRVGFKVELTDGDVAAILSMAHDQVVRGKQESTVVKGLRYMTAWHGSPHNFDKFDISKIGSGEGAQIFGWGLYFTDTKEIAEKQYRDRLSQTNIMVGDTPLEKWYYTTQPVNPRNKYYDGVYHELVDIFKNENIDAKQALALIQTYHSKLEAELALAEEAVNAAEYTRNYEYEPDGGYISPSETYNQFAELLELNSETIKALEALQNHVVQRKTTGKLYQVDIKPEEDDFLLWDKPLTEQSPKVLSALRNMGMDIDRALEITQLEKEYNDYERRYGGGFQRLTSEIMGGLSPTERMKIRNLAKRITTLEQQGPTPRTGGQVYKLIEYTNGRSPQAASLALLDAGIRGNKYLDGNSRGPFVENPTYNYVLFDDSDVSVINKYMRPKTPEQRINRGVQKAQLSSGATFFEGLTDASHGWIEGAKENAEARLEAVSVNALPKKLAITTTSSILEAIKRLNPVVGATISQLSNIEPRMRGMRQSMKKALTRRVKEFEKFVKKNTQDVISGTMTIARVNRVDVTSANSLAELLKNDKAANLYRGYLVDPSMSPAQKAAYKNHLKNREDDIRAAWAAWEKLGQQEGGQQLYKQVRQFYKDMYTALRAEQDDNIRAYGLDEKATDRLIAEAHKGENEEGLTDENDRFPGIPENLFPNEYFPFRRFGNYALLVGGKGTDIERERYHFESAFERRMWQNKRARQLGLKKGTPEYNATFKQLDSLKDMRDSMAGDSVMLGKMFKIIDESTLMRDFDSTQFATKEQANEAAKNQLKDQLYQTYLMTLPERSLRKQFLHAEKMTGNSADALRIFKNAVNQYSSQLPKLAYGREAQRLIETAYDTIDETKRDPAEMAKLRTMVDAYVGRYRETVNPTNGPGKIENLTSTFTFFSMLTSAYTAGAQLFSVPMQSMPRMNARYGYAETAKVMGHYMPVFDTVDMFTDVDPVTGEKHLTQPSLGNAPSVQNNPLRRRFWDELNNKRDLFSQHIVSMRLRDRPTTVYGTKGVLNKAGSGYEQLVHFSGALMSSADQLSREMVGMAFAELHYNKLRKEGVSHEQAFEKAVDEAVKNTDDTLGNYTELDKMTALRGDALRRFVGFLRNYAVQRTKYYFRQMDAMTRGSPYQTRMEAFHELMGTVLLGAMSGGVKTVFGYSAACFLINTLMKSLMSDEDKERWRREHPKEAFDSDYWFRNVWIPYHFGTDSMITKIAKHGALAEMTGADLGPRISQNDLWIRDVRQGDDWVDTATNVFLDNLSPKLSEASQLKDALKEFGKGNMSRVFSKAMPAAVRGWFTANRLATEGEVQESTGRTVMAPEEFTTLDLINQRLGATPLKLAEAREENRKILGWKHSMEDERNNLIKETRMMLSAPHTEQDITAAIAKIIAYNNKVPTVPGTNYGDPTYIIERKDIAQSIKTAEKKAQKSIRGVEMSPAERSYLQ